MINKRHEKAFERAELALGALVLELTGTGVSTLEITNKVGAALLTINQLKQIML